MTIKGRKLKPLVIATSVGSLFVLSLGVIWVFSLNHNYAKDVAKPLEKILITGGAIKKCEASGTGHGPDDYTPGYTAYYETSLNHDQTVALINKAANNNGFHLKQAAPGDLPSVGDNYISNYYIDHTNRISKLPWAEEGPVQLTIAIGNAFDTDKNKSYTVQHPFCDTKNDVVINNDAQHTAIELDLKLPKNRW